MPVGSTVKFSYESASAKLIYLAPRIMSLRDVESREKRKGHARGLMDRVVQYANNLDLTLLLVVGAYGHDPEMMNNHQLERFYGEYGFVREEIYPKKPVHMIRYPGGRSRVISS